jgi:hypothetical protein
MLRSSSAGFSIYHLVHPRPAAWDALFRPIAQHFGLFPIQYSRWLQRLKKSRDWFGEMDLDDEAEQLKLNPALKLIDFFESAAGVLSGSSVVEVEHHAGGPMRIKAEVIVETNRTKESRDAVCEAFGFPTLAVVEAERAAPSLKAENFPQLNSGDAMRWIKYWISMGYLK